MKRVFCFVIIFLFISIVLFAAKSDTLFSHIPYKSAQWKSKTTITGKNKPMVIEQNVFYKNGKMRTETEMKEQQTGEKQKIVTITDDKFIYSYDKNKKQGTKISISSDSSMNPEKQNIEMSKCRKSAIKKGNEKIAGVQCTKYEYTCNINNAKFFITEWRNKDGYPVKTVSKYEDIITTVETFNLKTNISLPDSLFKPESGVKFMDMEKMLGETTKQSIIHNQNSKIKDEYDENIEEQNGDESSAENEEIDSEKIMKDMMKKYMNK